MLASAPSRKVTDDGVRHRSRARTLWDSYFFRIGPFSKPYAGRAHISPSILDHPAAAVLRRWRPYTLVQNTRENQTMDVAVLAIGAVFFGLAFAYVAVCDKL